MGIRHFFASVAKRWADRRVARQAELEDFPTVEEPKRLPDSAYEEPPAKAKSRPKKKSKRKK
jgi:hypothetical protein